MQILNKSAKFLNKLNGFGSLTYFFKHVMLPYFFRKMNDSYLVELGVQMLTGYADPYHGRFMFILHYLLFCRW